VYLLGVASVSMRFGRGAAVASACLAVASFDFFMVPPYLTLAVHDPQYVVTFAVMLVVALLIGDMAVRLRVQGETAVRLAREAETERLRNALLSSVSHDLRTPLAA